MSDHPRRPLAEMQTAAARLLDELRPYCDRIEVAGSIRRRAPLVSDIEIVCVPRVETRRDPADLFRSETVNRLDDVCRAQLAVGRFQHRLSSVGTKAFGERYKRLLVDGIPVDLFSVLPPASWGVILVIRTGPAEFSKRLVTQRRFGGWLPDDCHIRDGAVRQGPTRMEMRDEEALFAFCGRAFIEPEARR